MVTLLQSSSSMASLTRLPHYTSQTLNLPTTIRSNLSIPKVVPLGQRSNDQNKNTKTTLLLSLESTSNYKGGINPTTTTTTKNSNHDDDTATKTFLKLQVILEAILDRIEMHHNVGEQRNNWNILLLNSLNMVTLTAATMAGVGSMGGPTTLPLKISSVLLFSAATGILSLMNKIQPSELVEEQRNAVRLFKQLRTKIQTTLDIQNIISDKEVEDAMEKVLALDRAYPLPLLGTMLDKFPKTFKPAVWWPASTRSDPYVNSTTERLFQDESSAIPLNRNNSDNGWSKELEEELRDIVGVIERRDKEDYIRLGNKALKFNKMLAKTGPILMGVAVVASAFAGHGGPWTGLMAATAGSMASVVNSIQHGGQVGMVFEMYRNCAGFFSLLEESVEKTIEEGDLEKRENGELFEMKMALKLGRSLSELRDFAAESSCSWLSSEDGISPKGEFASKLF